MIFCLLGIAEQRRKVTARSSEDCLSLLKIKYLQTASSAAAVSFRVAQGIGVADDESENVSFGSVFFASKKMNSPNKAKPLNRLVFNALLIPKYFFFKARNIFQHAIRDNLKLIF